MYICHTNPYTPAARVVVGGVELVVEVVVCHAHHEVEGEKQRVPGIGKPLGCLGTQMHQRVQSEAETRKYEGVYEQEPGDVVDYDMLKHGRQRVYLGVRWGVVSEEFGVGMV